MRSAPPPPAGDWPAGATLTRCQPLAAKQSHGPPAKLDLLSCAAKTPTERGLDSRGAATSARLVPTWGLAKVRRGELGRRQSSPGRTLAELIRFGEAGAAAAAPTPVPVPVLRQLQRPARPDRAAAARLAQASETVAQTVAQAGAQQRRRPPAIGQTGGDASEPRRPEGWRREGQPGEKGRKNETGGGGGGGACGGLRRYSSINSSSGSGGGSCC